MASFPSSLEESTSREILQRFNGRAGPEICLGLERIRSVLDRLGNPHLSLPPSVHIAGTNGKGSVCAYLKALLVASGARVHAFTSPHLMSIHDSITLNGTPIAEDRLARALATVEAEDQDQVLTSFEALTVAAFIALSSEPADFVLIEAGMGGRDDSTNVLERPAATVLTPIGLDHQEFLGPDITSIAAHKAGILKKGCPAIVGPQMPEALDVIEKTADRLSAPLSLHNQDWTAYEQHGRLVFQDDRGLLDLSLPRLHGRFQIDNAGIAIAAFRRLAPTSADDLAVIETGLNTVQWPGRLQRLAQGPLLEQIEAPFELWIDGGHNVHAAHALSQALADMDERAPLPTHLILGMKKNKDLTGFLDAFRDLVRSIQAVPLPADMNGYAPEEIAAAALQQGFAVEVASTVEKAVANLTKDAAQPKRILICGSLSLAGQILETHS